MLFPDKKRDPKNGQEIVGRRRAKKKEQHI